MTKEAQDTKTGTLMTVAIATVIAIALSTVVFLHISRKTPQNTQAQHIEDSNKTNTIETIEPQNVLHVKQSHINTMLNRHTWHKYLSDDYYAPFASLGRRAYEIVISIANDNAMLQMHNADHRYEIIKQFKERFQKDEDLQSKLSWIINSFQTESKHPVCVLQQEHEDTISNICAEAILQFQEADVSNLESELTLRLQRWFMSLCFPQNVIYCTKYKLKQARVAKNTKHKNKQKVRQNIYEISDSIIHKILTCHMSLSNVQDVYMEFKNAAAERMQDKDSKKQSVKSQIKKLDRTLEQILSMHTYIKLSHSQNKHMHTKIWSLIHSIDQNIALEAHG